ncbi:MAG: hypothetical protein HQL99_15315 [Magnetococcales bacterium]|nr:hypothetical protein [Magnetococcales bacterium]
MKYTFRGISPGINLFCNVKRALKRRRTSFSAWCRRWGCSPFTARQALLGNFSVRLGAEICDTLIDELHSDLCQIYGMRILKSAIPSCVDQGATP